MNRGSKQPVKISLRLYRALANAFPYEFKNAYGDELMQAAEDAIEPIWRQHGVPGLLRLLLDIAIRVPAEHGAEVWQDVRYGLRMLRGSKGFTAVSLLSLGLGIAVATSAFSEMNAVILRRLPGVPQPDQLAAVQPAASYPAYQRFRQRSDLFSDAFAYVAPVPFGVWLDGHTERIWGHLVTPSCFSMLGASPVLGRVFQEGEEAVVVSYRFWQNRLGSDPSIVGKTMRVNGHPFQISGVAPEQFLGAAPMYFAADLWLPVSVDGRIVPELAGNALEQRDRKMFQVVGRLNPGVTEARAEAELDTVARQLEQAYGEEDPARKGRRLRLAPGGKMFPIRSDDLPMVTVFPLVLVSLVLLIACSNVANMMLARATGRRKEIAVRLALGASRARLIRQLLTESMLVAAGAGVVGFVLAVWLMHLASQVRLPFPTPVSYDMTPDGRVLAFTLVLTMLTGVAFGLAPALQATRTDLAPALKEGGNVRLRRYRRLSLRNLLVVSQVAGSLALLLITGFLVLGFQRSTGMNVGFSGVNLHLISLDPIRDGYSGAQAADLFTKLLDRVKTLPGVTAATLTDTVPMSISGEPAVTFSTPPADAQSARVVYSADKYVVGKDYFDTLGIPVLLGRGFRKEDEANDRATVIVSEKLVQTIWGGGNAVGQRIEIGASEMVPGNSKLNPLGSFDHRPLAFGKSREMFEVVGVVRDTRHGLGLEKPRPAVFFPLRATDYARPSLQGVTLMVRMAGSGDVLGTVRREIHAMDAKLTPFNGHSMTEQLDHNLSLIRMAVWTHGSVGFFGLILAAVGLAGVTAYSVAQRGREIGIRVALGAGKGDVLGLVMKEGAALVMVGSAIGLGCAWGATRVLAAFMSAISRTVTTTTSDPVLLFGAPLLLAGLALAACYLPARKSMRIDPAVALRQE